MTTNNKNFKVKNGLEVAGEIGVGSTPSYGTTGQILSSQGAGNAAAWIDVAPAASYTSVLKHDVRLAESITKGQAVYISSSNGSNMVVSKASNASEATSSKTLGLLESSGSTNNQRNVVTEGLLGGIDVGAAAAGDPVWLGTSGNLIYGLTNKPIAPAHLVFIGIVTRDGNNGEIFVRVQNGFELNEIHNVLIGTDYTANSIPADNEFLAYNLGTNLWINQTAEEAGVANLSGATFTGNVAGTNISLSGNANATTFYGSGAGLTSIPNSALVNNSITINGNAVALGGSVNIAGGGGNSFETISANGTSVVADSSTDTLTITPGDGLSIAGNATSDTITFTPNVAGASANGIVTTGTQTFAGAKTFTGNVAGTNANLSGNVSAKSFSVTTNRTNLVTNPNVELNVVGWASQYSGTERTTDNPHTGTYSLRATTNGEDPYVGLQYGQANALVIGTSYRAGVWVRIEYGTRTFSFDTSFGPGTTESLTFTATTSWQFIQSSARNATGTTFTMSVYGESAVLFVDSAILETTSTYTGTFFDGNTTDAGGVDYAWTGTANASTSTATGSVGVANLSGATFTGNVTAANFIGNTNASTITVGTIDNARTNANSANGASTIVARDANGSFAGNVITATTFNGINNYIINGGFDFWQRGTSFTASGYTADRWYFYETGVCTVSQETTSLPSGFRYALKAVASTSSDYAEIAHYLESVTVIPLRGKTVTFSAYLKMDTNMRSLGDFYFLPSYGNTTDARASTTLEIPGTVAAVLTKSNFSDWARMSYTFVVPSNAVTLELRFSPPVTTVSVSTSTWWITGAQLEVGSVATEFKRAGSTYTEEQNACFRYYYRAVAESAYGWFGQMHHASSSLGLMQITLPTNMRTIPSTIESTAISTFQYLGATGTLSSLSLSSDGSNSRQITVNVNGSGFGVNGSGFLRANNSATAFIGVTAEL